MALVAGDDVIRFPGLRAFEYPVIGRVGLDNVKRLRGLYALG